MLTKAQIKHIRSLAHHKSRIEAQQFVVEGVKLAEEWLKSGASIAYVVGVEAWCASNLHLLSRHPEAAVHVVPEHVLQQLSGLVTANMVLLVAQIPASSALPRFVGKEWALALDDIQDPGNMGTIIRVADWFGVSCVLCSPGCVDVYSPKVVQSAMGGHQRVQLLEAPLDEALHASTAPIYAATLEGNNIFTLRQPKAGIVLIGNESKGISASLLALATHAIRIPGKGGAESLNAGVSAGIICALLMGNS